MKVTQVDETFVREHMDSDAIYRVMVCDDGNYGHSHKAARLKPLKNLKVDELQMAFKNASETAFILIEE